MGHGQAVAASGPGSLSPGFRARGPGPVISRSAGIARGGRFRRCGWISLVIARSWLLLPPGEGFPGIWQEPRPTAVDFGRVDECPSCGDTRAEFASDKNPGDTECGNTKKEIVCSEKIRCSRIRGCGTEVELRKKHPTQYGNVRMPGCP